MCHADISPIPRDPFVSRTVSGLGHTFALRVQHERAWILYARVAARTRACAYVAVLGLRDGHTAASVQTQLDGWATTATIAGYASTNVSHLLVRQLPRIRTVLRGFVRVEVQGRRGKGTGRRGERICRDRRHVEPLCRDSSCAMCVVCRKRDGARHTPRLRRRRDPFL